MQNLSSLNNLNALGIKGGAPIFDPSQIKVDGQKSLLQQLLTKQVPTIGGIIYDERKNKGTARPAQQGRAYLFDGIDDYIDTGIASNALSTTRSFSVWFTSSNVTLLQRIFQQANTITTRFGLTVQSSQIQLSGTSLAVLVSSAISNNTIYHVVGITDGTNHSLYVNGVLIGSSTTSITTSDTANIFIGASPSVTNHFNGKMFDFHMYEKALTQDEVTYIYSQGKSGVKPTNLYAQYKMDEQSGTTSYDSSGNAKHGTVTNATLSTFHSTQNLYSYQNEVGYSKPSTVFIPRNEAIPTQDVLGGALQYTGEVPYDADLEQSNCLTFDGVDDTISCGNIGTVNNFKGWVKFYTTNQNIWTLTDNVLTRIHVVAGVLTAGTSLTISSIKVNGVTQTATQAGASLNTLAWCYLEIGFTSTSSTALIIGRGDGAGTHGNIKTAGWSFLNNTTVQASYPMAEGNGLIAFDISGNNKHGTLVNSPVWSKQDVYHYNMVQGCGKRMNFDGLNDYVRVSGLTSSTSYFGACTIRARIFVDNATGTQAIFSLGTNCYRLYITGGQYTINTGIQVGAVTAGYHQIDVEFDSIGDGIRFRLDGVDIWTGSSGVGGTPNTYFDIGARDGGLLWQGSIWDFSITGSIVKNFAFNGYGNTNSNWLDTSGGGTNGIVNGSPTNRYIPAKTTTLDVLNATLTNPAGAYHNGAETLIDFTGNVLSPVAVRNSWETNWAFNTARVNPEFKRTLTSGGVDDRADRFLAYRNALSGTNLTKVQKYVATKSI